MKSTITDMYSTQKKLLLLLAVTATIMINDVTSKPSNNARHANAFTRALGNKEFRICKARTFSFLLHAVCLHHRPHIQFKKVAIRSTSKSSLLYILLYIFFSIKKCFHSHNRVSVPHLYII